MYAKVKRLINTILRKGLPELKTLEKKNAILVKKDKKNQTEIHELKRMLAEANAKVDEIAKKEKRLNDEIRLLKRKQYYNYCASLPKEKYSSELANLYYKRTGSRLDFDHLNTFNEKTQWFKLYGITPQITDLADKIKVRQFVKEKIGEDYLIPLLGTWKYPEDIDFDNLPDQFVIKANHGSGYNYIVRDKETFNRTEFLAKANNWLEEDFSFGHGFEMQYHGIERRLLVEKYIENQDGDLFDYKVWCFNGKAEYIQFLSDRKNELKMDFFDREWNRMPFVYDHPHHENSIPKPANLDELIEKSEELAQGFAHVRVDFYRLNDGKLYFSEMTFTSSSGFCHWEPKEADLEIGKKYILQ